MFYTAATPPKNYPFLLPPCPQNMFYTAATPQIPFPLPPHTRVLDLLLPSNNLSTALRGAVIGTTRKGSPWELDSPVWQVQRCALYTLSPCVRWGRSGGLVYVHVVGGALLVIAGPLTAYVRLVRPPQASPATPHTERAARRGRSASARRCPSTDDCRRLRYGAAFFHRTPDTTTLPRALPSADGTRPRSRVPGSWNKLFPRPP